MDPESSRAAAFVRHLLENPVLTGLTPLEKEEQILLFLQENGRQLAPTLSSPSFFEGQPWTRIHEILADALLEETNGRLKPFIEDLIERGIELAFASLLQGIPVSTDKCREELRAVAQKIVSKPETRQALAGPLAAVHLGLPERYLAHCFEDRQYIHFELTKVERLRMSLEEVSAMIRAALLLRPAVFLHSGASLGTGLVEAQFAEKALGILRGQFKALPAPLLHSALASNTSFHANPSLEASARLVVIFASLGRNRRPAIKVDRGAGTPERSWFGIARRNFRLYGLDGKMLDELYKISSENGW